ncbi:MAG: hypothetical protein EOT05_02325 [Candidatus Microsaccharimonas sossegonensis]|uniref:Uncharacterized protein n=1 Tax=Candidatus Microsaccharimonas sossegonensis TaxID=2506948 RepID=A0A4Q0AHI1_9BACT|nr:MAG: hypothetical protein EOT05_02325 [Candidatus Microsaccharimonas sossegonensis]
MEFLKLVRRRSFLSEVVYTLLNVAFAVALVLVISFTESIPLALGLVLISKWRVLAVRARYWFVNIRSNLVDIIVSVSIVVGLYTIDTSNLTDSRKFLLLAITTALYVVWLLIIKPRSKRTYVAAQAGIAVLLGTAALYTVSFSWPVSVVVIGMWLIGYSAANHILNTYDDETHGIFLSLAWSVIFAEIGWVAYHWTIAYSLPFATSLLIPQIAMIGLLIGFVAYKAYDSFYHHQRIRTSDILLPLLFSLSVIAVLVLVFNRVGTAI